MAQWLEERQAVRRVAQEMARKGLVVGTSGNVSVRIPGGKRGLLAITPSGHPYETLQATDIPVIDFEGEPVEGEAVPSTETLTHVAIYRCRPDVHAVIHTHSVYASVAAVAGLEIPPIVDEMVVRVGGAVKVAEYGFPSSQELADRVVEALGKRNAVLLRNHGLVGVERTLDKALAVCELVERVAQVFLIARLLGRDRPLPQEAMEAELALFRMQQAADGS